MNEFPGKDSSSIDNDGQLIPFKKRIFTVGTIRYTFAGLMMMFFWILWGDFVFTIIDAGESKNGKQ